MSYACLIPYHREDKIQNAIQSAEQDGWIVETIKDRDRVGQSKMREALLNRAFADPKIKYIRYLDDDDTLLPHLEHVSEVFNRYPLLDVIYTNYEILLPDGRLLNSKYSGYPNEDLLMIHPWSWIAKKESLRKIKNIDCQLWNYSYLCSEGGYCWLQFIQHHLNIRFEPVNAYHYNKSYDSDCVSAHPYFERERQKLISKFQEIMRTQLPLI